MVTSHSILSPSWVGERSEEKSRHPRSDYKELFSTLTEQASLEGNDCSRKPPTHRPQHVCEELTLTCGGQERWRKSGRTRSDKTRPSNRHIQPASATIFQKKNIQRKSTIMQKNTFFLCRTGLQSSKGLRLISILKTNFHSSGGEGWI